MNKLAYILPMLLYIGIRHDACGGVRRAATHWNEVKLGLRYMPVKSCLLLGRKITSSG